MLLGPSPVVLAMTKFRKIENGELKAKQEDGLHPIGCQIVAGVSKTSGKVNEKNECIQEGCQTNILRADFGTWRVDSTNQPGLAPILGARIVVWGVVPGGLR